MNVPPVALTLNVPVETFASVMWISKAVSFGATPEVPYTGCAAVNSELVIVAWRKPGVTPPLTDAASSAAWSCVTSCAAVVFVVAVKPATVNVDVIVRVLEAARVADELVDVLVRAGCRR